MAKSFLLIAAFWIAQASAEPLRFQITNLRSTEGFVAISVFEGEEGFPESADKAKFTRYVQVTGETVTIEADLPPGTYAAALMHDENGDKKMNFNWLGMPKEGFGFSGNPTIYFGPPSFEKAHVSHPAADVTIKMKYF